VFERSERPARSGGPIAHFGFRLTSPDAIDHAAALVTSAGGTVVEQGEFVAGEPYLFARDRDGHLLEIWYELPTPVDPT
jgi:catechol 2,3-dioxygenase-like lactoylglutathione lyase family enzyme